MKAKAYLGDGVFVEWDRGMVKLTTENGICVTNTIYLEPAVLEAFIMWCEIPEAEKSE